MYQIPCHGHCKLIYFLFLTTTNFQKERYFVEWLKSVGGIPGLLKNQYGGEETLKCEALLSHESKKKASMKQSTQGTDATQSGNAITPPLATHPSNGLSTDTSIKKSTLLSLPPSRSTINQTDTNKKRPFVPLPTTTHTSFSSIDNMDMNLSDNTSSSLRKQPFYLMKRPSHMDTPATSSMRGNHAHEQLENIVRNGDSSVQRPNITGPPQRPVNTAVQQIHPSQPRRVINPYQQNSGVNSSYQQQQNSITTAGNNTMPQWRQPSMNTAGQQQRSKAANQQQSSINSSYQQGGGSNRQPRHMTSRQPQPSMNTAGHQLGSNLSQGGSNLSQGGTRSRQQQQPNMNHGGAGNHQLGSNLPQGGTGSRQQQQPNINHHQLGSSNNSTQGGMTSRQQQQTSMNMAGHQLVSNNSTQGGMGNHHQHQQQGHRATVQNNNIGLLQVSAQNITPTTLCNTLAEFHNNFMSNMASDDIEFNGEILDSDIVFGVGATSVEKNTTATREFKTLHDSTFFQYDALRNLPNNKDTKTKKWHLLNNEIVKPLLRRGYRFLMRGGSSRGTLVVMGSITILNKITKSISPSIGSDDYKRLKKRAEALTMP